MGKSGEGCLKVVEFKVSIEFMNLKFDYSNN